MGIVEQLKKACESKRKATLEINNYLGEKETITGVVTLVRPKAICFTRDTPNDISSSSSKALCMTIMINDIYEVNQ